MKRFDNANNTGDSEIYARKSPKKLTLITVAVIAAVILFNIIFSIIGDDLMLYIDLSQVKYNSGVTTLYTLSDTCKDMISDQAVPMINRVNEEREARGEDKIKVKIVFCADRDNIEKDGQMRYISYTARAIANANRGLVEVEYINIRENPSSVQKYKTTSAATINDSDVIVEFGTEYLVQGVSSFMITDTTETEPWAYNGEKRLTSMILAVTRAEAPICCITNNHGETLFDENGEYKAEYSTFIKLIEGAGYVPQILDLEKDEIPADCRMMITFDPTKDFKAFGNLGEDGVSEIEKLDKYLDEANSFFYICGADAAVLPNLEEYLVEWGIKVARVEDNAGNLYNFVLEDKIAATDSGEGVYFAGEYFTDGLGGTLTEDMRDRSIPPQVVFGNSTAIVPADNYMKYYTTADETTGAASYEYYSYFRNGVSRDMFDVFTSTSTATANVNGKPYEVATELKRFKLMTVTHEMRSVQEDNYTSVNRGSYVVALASTEFLKNEILDSTAYGNTDVVLSALRNTGNEVVPTNIPLKSFYEYGIENEKAYLLSKPEVWFWCLILIPPIAATVTGTVITVRRKYR